MRQGKVFVFFLSEREEEAEKNNNEHLFGTELCAMCFICSKCFISLNLDEVGTTIPLDRGKKKKN